MSFCFPRLPAAMFLILTLCFTTNLYASGSGAFRVEVPDAGAFGKGSAFVGEANTPAAVYYNPAGLNQVKELQVSVGGAILGPQVNYKPASGPEVQMRRNTFFIPHVYAAIPVVSNKLTFGFGAMSYFGLGTEWAQDSPLKYIATESVIENKDYMLTAAYQVSDQWSFALSLDNDDSKVSLKKKFNLGVSDGDMQLKGKDDAFGYRLATMYKLNEQNQFGLMYRSRISHKYEGKAYLNSSDPTFLGVFGGGSSYETKFTEKFTLPQSVVLGYSFKPASKWTFNFDIEWMDWSSVKHQAVNWTDETNTTRLSILNAGNPASRDWKSVFSESLGLEYAVSEQFRLRTGYYHHASPIGQDGWDPSLPDANSHGFTAGLGYDLTKNLTIDLAYSLMLFEKRNISNTNGSATGIHGVTDNGKYSQITNLELATLTYKF